MADINYTGHLYSQGADARGAYPAVGAQPAAPDTQTPEGKSSVGAALSVMGAMASLALVAGIGVWGYKLMVRDVSGVPVVRALAGPMRLQPDDPGGDQADHQGLAVNAVAAQGTAAPTADRLLLAPRPVTLADEDVPLIQIKPKQVAVTAPAIEPKSTDVVLATATFGDQTQEGLIAEEAQALAVAALVEELTAGVAPMSGEIRPVNAALRASTPDSAGVADRTATTPDKAEIKDQVADGSTEDALETELIPQLAVVTGPGVATSLRPLARPARAVASGTTDVVLASAINSAVKTVASLDVDPDSLPVGTRLAQLGAYDSAEIARAEWDRMNLKFEEYMDGKKRVVQKATSGGRTFYRLRAMGFDDLSAARRFCSALVSENADCIPVTTR